MTISEELTGFEKNNTLEEGVFGWVHSHFLELVDDFLQITYFRHHCIGSLRWRLVGPTDACDKHTTFVNINSATIRILRSQNHVNMPYFPKLFDSEPGDTNGDEYVNNL